MIASKAAQEANLKHIYTVSEITRDIKLILNSNFPEVWIEAEVSNFKAYPSGHFYFSLKDESAVLPSVMFMRTNREVKFRIEDGLKVICFGRIDVYAQRGSYQLIVEKIEPKGIGAQQLAFEQLKKKLFKEGLFDAKRKKTLPLMPFRIGIVTSSKGAAIRDILQILKKSAPFVDVIIRSVRVQGESAGREIAEAVEEFNEFKKVDLIIVSRGGGSIEDLWPFNEEIVARAIFASRLPTVSAVGHQINITLADMVADVFVETPSAAAKIIVDAKSELMRKLDGDYYSLTAALIERINFLRNNLTALTHMLKNPQDDLLEKEQLLDELRSSLMQHIKHCLMITGEKFSSLVNRLEALSPLAVLSRGYSLSTLAKEGRVIKDAGEVEVGSIIKTILSKGSFLSKIQEVNKG